MIDVYEQIARNHNQKKTRMTTKGNNITAHMLEREREREREM